MTEDMSRDGIIRWENPPRDRHLDGGFNGKRRAWAVVAHQLRQRPGQWALVDEDASITLVPKINKGKAQWCLPAGVFHATARRIDGKLHVYVRYVGDPEL